MYISLLRPHELELHSSLPRTKKEAAHAQKWAFLLPARPANFTTSSFSGRVLFLSERLTERRTERRKKER